MKPSFTHAFGFVEAILGLIFAAFCALGVIVVGPVMIAQWTLYDYHPPSRPLIIGFAALWILASIFEWRSVVLYGGSIGHVDHPMPVHIALRQRVRAAFLRPLVGCWWLVNAGTFVWAAHEIATWYEFFNPGPIERAIQIAVPVAILFAATVASNTYLLLAVHALTASREAVERVWRIRILIDLAIVFVSLQFDK